MVAQLEFGAMPSIMPLSHQDNPIMCAIELNNYLYLETALPGLWGGFSRMILNLANAGRGP
jgi:hypothetical protein